MYKCKFCSEMFDPSKAKDSQHHSDGSCYTKLYGLDTIIKDTEVFSMNGQDSRVTRLGDNENLVCSPINPRTYLTTEELK